MSFTELILKKADEDLAAGSANPSVNLLNQLTAESVGNSIQGAHSSNMLGNPMANPGGAATLNSANFAGDNDMDADDGAIEVKSAAYDVLMNTPGINQDILLDYAKTAYYNIQKEATMVRVKGNEIMRGPRANYNPRLNTLARYDQLAERTGDALEAAGKAKLLRNLGIGGAAVAGLGALGLGAHELGKEAARVRMPGVSTAYNARLNNVAKYDRLAKTTGVPTGLEEAGEHIVNNSLSPKDLRMAGNAESAAAKAKLLRNLGIGGAAVAGLGALGYGAHRMMQD